MHSRNSYRCIKDVASSVILTCVLLFFFQPFIDGLTEYFLPNEVITIKVTDGTDGITGPITLYQEGRENELFLALKEAADDNWVYHQGEKGKSWTFLTTNVSGAEVSFAVKAKSQSYLCFEANGRNGQAQLNVTGHPGTAVNTRTDSGATELIRVYPFEGSAAEPMTRHIVSASLGILLFLLLFLLTK